VELHHPDDLVHGVRHLDTAWGYAKGLLDIYGTKADIPVTTASIYLHDIKLEGENPLSGVERRVNSARTARTFLENIGWGDTDILRVQGAILQHDQPFLTPTTLEGSILKDSDFLAGFGAEGLIRVIVSMSENGQKVDGIIKTLEVEMPKRIKGLGFQESKEVAKAKWELVSDFLSDLKHGVLTIKDARKKLNDRDADRSDLAV
jgi:hypothetical protein